LTREIVTQKDEKWQAPFKIALLASTAHSLLDYDWQFSSVFLLFWTIAAFLTSQRQKGTARNSSNQFFFPLIFISLFVFLIGLLNFSSRLYLFKGIKTGEKGELKRAEKCFRQGLGIWPYNLENRQAAVDFYLKQEKEKQAAQALERLISFEPLAGGNYQQLADIYFKQEKKEKAFDIYLQAVAASPLESEEIHYRLIGIFLEQEKANWPLVYQTLTQLEKIKGEKCLLKCLGFENEEKALKLLLQLIKEPQFNQLKNREQARVYFWLAVLTTYQKDWNQDIDYLQKAIALDGQEEYQAFLADLERIQLIEISFNQGDYQRVRQLAVPFKERIENHSFHQKFYLDEVYSLLAEIAKAENRYEQAVEYERIVFEINPWFEKEDGQGNF